MPLPAAPRTRTPPRPPSPPPLPSLAEDQELCLAEFEVLREVHQDLAAEFARLFDQRPAGADDYHALRIALAQHRLRLAAWRQHYTTVHGGQSAAALAR